MNSRNRRKYSKGSIYIYIYVLTLIKLPKLEQIVTWVMRWSSVYECVITNGLNETLPEASKLVNLILAVPRTNTSVEWPCSAVERIRTYHWRSQSQNGLCGLALTSTETRVWWNHRHSLTAWQNLRTSGSKKWFKITNRSLDGLWICFRLFSANCLGSLATGEAYNLWSFSVCSFLLTC